MQHLRLRNKGCLPAGTPHSPAKIQIFPVFDRRIEAIHRDNRVAAIEYIAGRERTVELLDLDKVIKKRTRLARVGTRRPLDNADRPIVKSLPSCLDPASHRQTVAIRKGDDLPSRY